MNNLSSKEKDEIIELIEIENEINEIMSIDDELRDKQDEIDFVIETGLGE